MQPDKTTAALSRIRLLNLRGIKSRRGRVLVAVVVVAVSSMLVVAIVGTYASVSYSVERLTNDIAGSTDLEVTGVSESGFSDELLPLIAHTAGVSVAAPMVRRTLEVNGTRALLVGVDQTITGINSPLGEEWRRVLSGRHVDSSGEVVGPGLRLGDGESFELGSLHGHVSLVLRDQSAAAINQGDFIVAPLALAQEALDTPHRLGSVLVVVSKHYNLEKVRSELDRVTDGRAVVTTPIFRGAQTSSSLRFVLDGTLMVAAMALVVATFIVFNTMNMTVAQRRREIAILRALGAGRGAVGRDMLGEAALLGLVGGLAGIPLGVLAGRWMIGRLPPVLTQSFDANVRYYLPPATAPAAVALCMVACLLAAAVTVVSVLHIPPIEAIVPQGATGLQEDSQRGRAIVGCAGLFAVAAAGAMILTQHGTAQLAGSAVFLLGAIAVSYASLRLIAAATAKIAQSMGTGGRLAAVALGRSPARTWITAMTVAVAVSIGIATSGSMGNLVRTGNELFAPLGRADLYVACTPPNVMPTGPILPEDLASRIRAIRGVSSVVPAQYGYADLDGQRSLINGVSPGSVTPSFVQAGAGARDRLLAGDGALISRQLGKQSKLSTGDWLELKTPSGRHRVQVLGVIDYLTFDAGVVILPLAQMQRWFQRPGATYYEIHYSSSADAARTRQMITNLAPRWASIYSGAEEVDAARTAILQVGELAVGIQWIVAAVSAVALLNIFMLAVLQRRREIGVHRATGASRQLIGRAVFAEAASAGIVGGLAGTALGATAQYIGTSALSATTSVHIEYVFQPQTVLYGVGAIFLCVIGVTPPSIRAARMNIVGAVSSE